MLLMVFETEKLAGMELHMGGMFDDNGNFYREKDILENDFSSPILENGTYIVTVSDLDPERRLRRILIDETQLLPFSVAPASFILSEAEFNLSVREMTRDEMAKYFLEQIDANQLTDLVYRALRSKYVYQDVCDYILENNYDNEWPEDDQLVDEIDILAHEVANRIVYEGKTGFSNEAYFQNIKDVYEAVIVERSSHE